MNNGIPVYSLYDCGTQIGVWYEDEKLFVPIFDNIKQVVSWHKGSMPFLNLTIPLKENCFGNIIFVYSCFNINKSERTIYFE
jgi:hypothetical protein